MAQKALGIKGKMFAKKRYAEKALMKKTLAMHEESTGRRKVDDEVQEEAVPAFLLDRETTTRAKVLSNTIMQKRKEKAGKWEVPLPKVRPVAEDEMFKVIRSGKRRNKYSNQPSNGREWSPRLHLLDLVYKKTSEKNPNGPMYTSLGVITKGTIIEVNVSELGLVTPAGKVIWGKYAQVTNNPENDGCINAVLLV
ncbi:Ribosomal protein S8e/ribosomal biogenesis NSA2 [Melia azedarach]|uniref:Ribosomal protein S8e/ribosomal biogenesis NSA2 n=1 Tax=Melia azedarach TaxID=155640 RepID=A0ACC1X1F5_MELAZ|nr:Ribosomal protein S8e/ribosomal biogenesis NSA2 [Melia azedarach]